MQKTILLLGTMDTKGLEFQYVKDRIREKGHKTILMDAGVLGRPLLKPDISHEEVAEAAGTRLSRLVAQGKEGVAIESMTRGASRIVQGLHDAGKIHGVLSLGGSMGTSLATAVMRTLPIGLPKVMVSTMASSDTRVYLDHKDIVMIPSVADIVGLNRVTMRVLDKAAGAISGMVASDPGSIVSEKPLVALTLHGDLMPCMTWSKAMLEAKGYEVVVFAAVGSGGKAMEELIEQGVIHGVLDLVTHEISCHLFGGICDAGSSRLEAAGKKGIPQVVVPAKTDILSFSPGLGLPEPFQGRKIWMHNPDLGLVKLNREEMALVGETMAAKLNSASGPTAVIIPEGGLSSYGKGWDEFADEEADLALFEALKERLRPEIIFRRVDAPINEEHFAKEITDLLHQMIENG